METVRNQNIGKIIKNTLIFILIAILVVNAILVNRLNNRYVKAVEFDESKGYRREQHEDYYITVGGAAFFGDGVTASVSTNEVYYSEENSTIEVGLHIWADKYGNSTYYISFDDYDDGKEDFGGYADIDENLNFLPENEYATVHNEYIQKLLDDNREHIVKLAKIANDRWDLGLTVQGE